MVSYTGCQFSDDVLASGHAILDWIKGLGVSELSCFSAEEYIWGICIFCIYGGFVYFDSSFGQTLQDLFVLYLWGILLF